MRFFFICCFFAAATPAYGQVDVSGNLTAVSMYQVRGVNQTTGPTLQGGLTATHKSGWYALVWGSGVDFGEDPAKKEVDFGVGYGRSHGNFSWGVSALAYLYPGVPNEWGYDFYELVGTAAYQLGSVNTRLTFSYAPNFFAGTGKALYIDSTTSYQVTPECSVFAHLGYQIFERNDLAGPDYTDYSIGARYSVTKALTLSALLKSSSLKNCEICGGTGLIGQIDFAF